MGYYKNKYSNHNKKKHNAQQGGEKKSKMENLVKMLIFLKKYIWRL